MIVLVVHLTARSGEESAFRAYEDKALAIFAGYGRLLARIRPESGPTEIHVLTVPDEAAFQSYRSDPRVVQMAEERSRVVQETVIFQGSDLAGLR